MSTDGQSRMVLAYGMPLPDRDMAQPFLPSPLPSVGHGDTTTYPSELECRPDSKSVKICLSKGNHSIDIDIPYPLSDDDRQWIDGLWDTILSDD